MGAPLRRTRGAAQGALAGACVCFGLGQHCRHHWPPTQSASSLHCAVAPRNGETALVWGPGMLSHLFNHCFVCFL